MLNIILLKKYVSKHKIQYLYLFIIKNNNIQTKIREIKIIKNEIFEINKIYNNNVIFEFINNLILNII